MPRLLGATLFVSLLVLGTQARAEERPRSTTTEAAGRGPTTWMVASGGVLFGATYLISFGMASAGAGCGNAFLGMDCVPRNDAPGSDWPLFVPIAGPFVAMATSEGSANLCARHPRSRTDRWCGSVRGWASGSRATQAGHRTGIFALDLPRRSGFEFLQQILT